MTTPKGIVYVVDDDVSIREALGGLIRSNGLSFTAFSSAREFLAKASADLPCCLVLDIQMPGLSGLDLQRRLTESNRVIPIIFITGHGDVPTSVQAMKAGAAEFLIKPFSERELLGAIINAIERDRACRLHRSKLQVLYDRYELLTPREREVMAKVVSGLLNKQVAAELGTTEITIKVHRGRIMNKMRADSLADLVRISERLIKKPASS